MISTLSGVISPCKYSRLNYNLMVAKSHYPLSRRLDSGSEWLAVAFGPWSMPIVMMCRLLAAVRPKEALRVRVRGYYLRPED